MNPPFFDAATGLLQNLIRIPSFSRKEEGTAEELVQFFGDNNIPCQRLGNNVWTKNLHFDPTKPTVLLNSHHDTVKPVAGWESDPFEPWLNGGKLTGLGSNDAGGPLVSLIAAFMALFSEKNLPYNLVLAATAEEEISGKGGIEMLLPQLGDIAMGIVGEPTGMRMAVAEKGLMVLDVVVKGKSGHAAREEGINAIYEALPVIDWFRNYRFPAESEWLGPVKMSVTQVKAGTQHNVVPDRCELVVDVRPTDAYSLEEILEVISQHVQAEVTPRSVRLQPSRLPVDHPLAKAGLALGIDRYGSPTLSDQALMPFPTVKIGPGESERSHTAGEFIFLDEIALGIRGYLDLLQALQKEI